MIERTLNRITITIHTSRPGIIIGKGGGEVDLIKEELKKLTGKDVQINIVEIRRPEIDAAIVADSIARQIEVEQMSAGQKGPRAAHEQIALILRSEGASAHESDACRRNLELPAELRILANRTGQHEQPR